MTGRRLVVFALFALMTVVVVGGVRRAAAPADPTVRAGAQPHAPATTRVLAGAPDPSGPTRRDAWLDDPAGQIEQLTARGHLLAWTIRTPADVRDLPNEIDPADRPAQLPRSTTVAVADERGGAVLTVPAPRPWVTGLQLQPPTADGTQALLVTGCRTRRSGCVTEALSLPTAAPVRLLRRAPVGDAATARSRGLTLDRPAPGRCLGRVRLPRAPGAVAGRLLPPLPERDGYLDRCLGAGSILLREGPYVFASVRRDQRRSDLGGLSAESVLGLDTRDGDRARWRVVQVPYRFSDYGGAIAAGPAVTPNALYWEELDEYGDGYSLQVVRLPRDLRAAPVLGRTPTTTDPVAPDAGNVCTIAATDDAIYELRNARCAITSNAAGEAGISRLVHPLWVPEVE